MLFYTEPGQMVVDPFAGHNSRMDLCVENGRHYTGCDLSHEFMAHNKKRAAELRKEYKSAKIVLHEGDSRSVMAKVPSGSGDFTITSPPYYDVEYYGPEEEQLGNSKTYDAFMDGMEEVLVHNFAALRPGAFAAWFVADIRRKGTFHAYHVDLAVAAQRVGFTFHDIMIVDYGRGFRDAFINQTMKSRIIPKRHEYGLIFLKPE